MQVIVSFEPLALMLALVGFPVAAGFWATRSVRPGRSS
jgi:NADH:ubiquinone oxidoreductase subunit 2 (subunit N)